MAEKAVALGVHVLDILGRPVEEIPEGQGGTLIEQIRITPAGSAGGTAITLAKLGFEVSSVGAIGRDDLGDVLVHGLERFGVDCSGLVRRDDVQTSATILPIRANGDRPALHVIGANATFGIDDVPWEVVEAADVLHLGGPEFVAEHAPEILRRAREAGVRTSADILADGWPELLDMIAPVLEHVEFFFPNEDQARKLTGEDDEEAAGRALLERGAGLVAMTLGARGSLLVTSDGAERVPAFEVDVVDTTGCGDAFVAGFMRAISLGEEPVAAARLGSACAALVAGGLGSDAGEFDLGAAQRFAETASTGT